MKYSNQVIKFDLFSKGKSLINSTILYTFFSLLNAAGPFILIPFITAKLKTDEYGMIAMFSLIISVISPIVGFSINGAISRYYFIYEKSDFAKLISACLLTLITSVLLLTLISFWFKIELYNYASISFYWFCIAILISTFQFIHLMALLIWQAKNKVYNYGLFQAGYTFLNLGLSLLLIFKYNMGWSGRIYSWLFSASFFSIISILYLFKSELVSYKIDFKILSEALKFSFPIIPHAIGGLLIGLIDRVIITNIVGIESTGIYSISFQLSSTLNLLLMAFNTAFTPWLYKKLSSPDINFFNKASIVKLIYLIFLIIVLLCILLSVFLKLCFPFIVGVAFESSIYYVPVLLIGFGFNGMYLMVANFIFFAKKTNYLAISTFGIGLLNIPICIFLTRQYGLYGASFATSISYFLMFVASWFISKRVYQMPWFSFKKNNIISNV